MTGERSTISTRGGAGKVHATGQWWAPGRRWLIIGASLIIIATLVVIVLACKWPYTQQAVTYDHANLSVFEGISGTLSSQGKFSGQVTVKNGVATLSDLSFTAPGTRAQIQGTYNLMDRKVDLHGILYTDGKLSDSCP